MWQVFNREKNRLTQTVGTVATDIISYLSYFFFISLFRAVSFVIVGDSRLHTIKLVCPLTLCFLFKLSLLTLITQSSPLLKKTQLQTNKVCHAIKCGFILKVWLHMRRQLNINTNTNTLLEVNKVYLVHIYIYILCVILHFSAFVSPGMKIASFNVRRFGQAKVSRPDVLSTLVKVKTQALVGALD